MFRNFKILDEKDKRLRMTSKEVTFPLSKEEKQTIKDVMTYLKYSQIEKYAEKYKMWNKNQIQDL